MKEVKNIIISILYTILALFSTGILGKIVPISYFNEYFDTLSYIFPLAFTFFLIFKNGYEKYFFMEKIGFFDILKSFFPVFVVILFNFVFKILPLTDRPFKKNLIFLILNLILLNLAVAVFEETLFRNLVFNKIMEGDLGLKKSALISSILFGLFHLGNISQKNVNFNMVFLQIIYTFMLGIFFSGILIKYKNIFLIVLMHFLIDFSSSLDGIFQLDNQNIVSFDLNFSSFVFTVFTVSFCFISGLNYIFKSDDENFYMKENI